MAVTIPIISEFDGKGISKAIAQFQQLETTGQKAQFALQKAALPAAAAMTAVAAGIGLATKAAIEDAAAQDQLAGVLQRTTGATEAQIAANEQFITSLSMATAVADDQLRPAMSTLANVTGDVKTAQDILTQATDIAAATNTDLSTVVDALSKAYGGNMKGLQALDPSLRGVIKEGATFTDVMALLADKTGGAAARATETAAGKMKQLSVVMNETKESIGAAFLPILEAVLPMLQKMALFVQQNTTAVVAIVAVIGSFAGAILAANAAIKIYQASLLVARVAQVALNVAMAANPIGIVVVALAALAAGFVIAWQKSETFREIVGKVINFTIDGANKVVQVWENVANAVIGATNAIIRAINSVSPIDIPEIGRVNIGNIPKVSVGGGGGGSTGGTTPTVPGASSGLTPFVPDRIDIAPALPGGGGFGGGGGAARGGGGGGGGGVPVMFANMAPIRDINYDATLAREAALAAGTINVTVNTVTAPADLGETIVDALRDYNRLNGPVDVLVAS